jgi:hypothetical protein
MSYIELYYLENLNQNNGMAEFDQVGPGGTGGGGNGGGSTGGGGDTPNKDLTPEGDKDKSTQLGDNLNTADEYIFKITTEFLEGEPKGATVYVNGMPLPGPASKRYKVKLSTLFNNGPQTIEVKKSDYTSNQKYILEVIGVGSETVEDITLLEDPDSRQILGINKLQLRVKYFEDTQEKPFNLSSTGTLVSLPFIFTKNVNNKIDTNLSELKINLIGPNSSVQLIADNDEDLLNTGEDIYEDVTGTKYFIKSPDTTLFRISEITITDSDGNSELLTAGKSESISMELVLNKDLNVSILSHRVVKKKVLKPLIRLKSPSTKKYNINDKTDIPLIVEKNDDVVAISMVIGKEILEFDNLQRGPYAGIKIPHRLIDKIGKYNIKLFPYSISELQKSQKNTDINRSGSSVGRSGSGRNNPIGRSGSGSRVTERSVLINTQVETDKSLPPLRKTNTSIGRSGSDSAGTRNTSIGRSGS